MLFFYAHSIQLYASHNVKMVATVLLQTHAPAVLDGLEICAGNVCVIIASHQLTFQEQVILAFSPACGVWSG